MPVRPAAILIRPACRTGAERRAAHLGDLGNIRANKSGIARFAYTDNQITLEGVNSIIGHSVVVHARADDLKSQPSGNAGARVACGVIETRKGPKKTQKKNRAG